MPAPRYAASLRGLTLNLVVREVDAALRFQRDVLGATVIYADPDFAVLERNGDQWILHADHAYDQHPLHPEITRARVRGVGCEIRLHLHDPDLTEARARQLGYQVVQPSADKGHGLRECFIRDADGYVWVVDRPLDDQ